MHIKIRPTLNHIFMLAMRTRKKIVKDSGNHVLVTLIFNTIIKLTESP